MQRIRTLFTLLVMIGIAGIFARVTLAGLSGAADFTVEEVRVEGVRYLDPAQVLHAAGVAALTSSSLGPAELERIVERVAVNPLVARVTVRRSLPAALVIVVTERVPVALLPGAPVLGMDAEGTEMPQIDATRYPSLPFVTGVPDGPAEVRRESLLRAAGFLQLLDEETPRLADRVSEIRPRPGGEIDAVLIPDGLRVRLDERGLPQTLPLVTALVEEGRSRYPGLSEVDLRFAGTVIYRQREGGA